MAGLGNWKEKITAETQRTQSNAENTSKVKVEEPLNGTSKKSGQERRKARKTGDCEGLRVHEDLFLPFLPSCLLLAAWPLNESVPVPRGRRARENISDERLGLPLGCGVRRAVSLWKLKKAPPCGGACYRRGLP